MIKELGLNSKMGISSRIESYVTFEPGNPLVHCQSQGGGNSGNSQGKSNETMKSVLNRASFNVDVAHGAHARTVNRAVSAGAISQSEADKMSEEMAAAVKRTKAIIKKAQDSDPA